MSALEEIEAAIEKLSALRGDTPWALAGGGEWINPIGITVAPDDGGVSPREADLIVTLHRTIDAQLRILKTAIADIVRWTDADSEWGWEPQDGPTPKDSAFIAKLDLARAINGTAS